MSRTSHVLEERERGKFLERGLAPEDAVWVDGVWGPVGALPTSADGISFVPDGEGRDDEGICELAEMRF